MRLGRVQLKLRSVWFAALMICAWGASAETPNDSPPASVWGVVATDTPLPKSQITQTTKRANERAAPAHLSEKFITRFMGNFSQQAAEQIFQVDASPSALNRHRLTDGRSLIGWKLSETVYFGRAKKDRAAVSLIWQTSTEQDVSLSTKGMKLTRRFK